MVLQMNYEKLSLPQAMTSWLGIMRKVLNHKENIQRGGK